MTETKTFLLQVMLLVITRHTLSPSRPRGLSMLCLGEPCHPQRVPQQRLAAVNISPREIVKNKTKNAGWAHIHSEHMLQTSENMQ